MTTNEIAEATDRLERWALAQRPPITPTADLFDGIKRADELIDELDEKHQDDGDVAHLRARLVELRARLVRAAL